MENLIGIAVVGAIFVWMTWSRPNKGLEGYSPSQKVCQPAPRPTTEADVVSSSEPASSQPGWLIRTARIAAGSILLVCWPVFTFLLPFLFDDPTGGGRFRSDTVHWVLSCVSDSLLQKWNRIQGELQRWSKGDCGSHCFCTTSSSHCLSSSCSGVRRAITKCNQ
jgi:hypothetical protein